MDLHNATLDDEILPKSNATNATNDIRNELLAQIEVGTLATIFTMAILGNLFAVFMLLKLRKGRPYSHMYLLMIHLSIADILVAICNVLTQLVWKVTFRFYGPDALCRIVKFLQVCHFLLFH